MIVLLRRRIGMELNKKNLMILGIGSGVMLFFIGIASNILMGPATDDYRLPVQASSILKLTGTGMVTLAILVGGIFIEKLEIYTRLLLSIFGLCLLIINIAIISLAPYY